MLKVAQDVNHGSIRVDGKKAANAPRLIGKWIYNLDASLYGSGMYFVNVWDLDADIWMRRIRFAMTNNADLCCRIAR